MKVESEVEQVQLASVYLESTEIKETDKQPVDENQLTPTNTADKTAENDDNFETQAKAASPSKLKIDRKNLPFSVVLLLRLALVFGTVAGSVALSIEESDNMISDDLLQLNQKVSSLSRIVDELQKSETANLEIAKFIELRRNVSDLRGQFDNLQINILNNYMPKFERQLREARCKKLTGVMIGAISNTCYIAFEKKSTFSEAKSSCKNSGGMLAVVDSKEKQDALFKDEKRFWFGVEELSSIQAEKGIICANKTRTWVNGKSVSYTNWRKLTNEPSCVHGLVAENCVESSKMGWNDLNCDDILDGFYCQTVLD